MAGFSFRSIGESWNRDGGPEEATPLAGSTTDDDGQALDDILTPQPEGMLGADDMGSHGFPIVDDVPEDGFEAPDYTAMIDDSDLTKSATTRILTGRVSFASTDPSMVLPDDPNRCALRIWLDTAAYVASGKSDAGAGAVSPSGAGLMPPCGANSNGIVNMDGHTGPVWVAAAAADATKYLHYLAITK